MRGWVSDSVEAMLTESIEEKVKVSEASGNCTEESGRPTPLVRGGGGGGGGDGDGGRAAGDVGLCRRLCRGSELVLEWPLATRALTDAEAMGGGATADAPSREERTRLRERRPTTLLLGRMSALLPGLNG